MSQADDEALESEHSMLAAVARLIGNGDGELLAIMGAIVDALCQQPGIDGDKLRSDIRRGLAPMGREAWSKSVLLQRFAEHLRTGGE